MSDQVTKEMQGLSSSISEMFQSAAGAKGKQFAYAAMDVFTLAQLTEIASILSDKDSQIPTDILLESFVNLTESILCRSFDGMSDKDANEAFELGKRMMERKLDLQKKLPKIDG